jgi:hypothetical protein
MYVASGLGSYRTKRGMGDVATAPENPDTNVYDASGNIVPPNAGTTYGTVSGGTMPLNPSPSFQQWLNTNSTMVAVGAGVVVLAFLFAWSGR